MSSSSLVPSDSVSQISNSTVTIHKNLTSVTGKVNKSGLANSFFSKPGPDGRQKCLVPGCQDSLQPHAGTKTNLVNHMAGKHAQEWLSALESQDIEFIPTVNKPEGPIEKAVRISKQSLFDKNLLEWIIKDQQPYAKVKSPSFIHMIHGIDKSLTFVDETTISRRVKKLYAESKPTIFAYLQQQTQQFAFTTDVWSSHGGTPYISLTCHFISHDWKPFSATIGFSQFREKHTGINIYKKLLEILKDFLITLYNDSSKTKTSKKNKQSAIVIADTSDENQSGESSDSDGEDDQVNDMSFLGDRILSITMDNASNNNAFIDEALKNHLLRSPECHIRCFAHILNLAATEVLKDVDDSLSKLRAFVTHVQNSDQVYKHFQEICIENNVKTRRPVLNNATRWNSTFDMLNLALEQQPAIDNLLHEYQKAQRTTKTKGKQPAYRKHQSGTSKVAQ